MVVLRILGIVAASRIGHGVERTVNVRSLLNIVLPIP
jgi:hypothetical protein